MPPDSIDELYCVDKKGNNIVMEKEEEGKGEKEKEDEDEGYLNMGHTDMFIFL